MGPKSEVVAVPLSGGAGSASKNVAWAETNWHLDDLDPFNRLATIHQRHRQTDNGPIA